MSSNYVIKKDIDVGKRFVKICESLWPGASRQTIANNLGLKNESRIRLFENGSIPEIPVLTYLDDLGYSIKWLLLGKGEMKKATNTIPPTQPDSSISDLLTIKTALLQQVDIIDKIIRKMQ